MSKVLFLFKGFNSVFATFYKQKAAPHTLPTAKKDKILFGIIVFISMVTSDLRKMSPICRK